MKKQLLNICYIHNIKFNQPYNSISDLKELLSRNGINWKSYLN